ncbi:MAG: DUF4835 family protein [Flavobacteriales bacterium]|nr:DUF4835 family protein [Flavobacteriales bacterium]
MLRTCLILFWLACLSPLRAQEFNCSVTVIAPQVAIGEPRIWKNLENTVKEFMNSRRWTGRNYAPQERIDLNLLFTIQNQPSLDRFEGTLQVTYTRPVFGTGYSSPVIDLVDNDVRFNYLDNTVVEFAPDRFISNLASIVGFYAYFVLGLDGDTYAPLGGTDAYNLAQQVVNNAQNSPEAGWKGFEGTRNRFWLIDNQLQALFRPFRECLYTYHRQGMDLLHTDMAEGLKNISSSIEKLKPIHQARPASYTLQVFFYAKANELVELYKPVPPQDKTKLYNTLQIIDPANISKYQGMMRGS